MPVVLCAVGDMVSWDTEEHVVRPRPVLKESYRQINIVFIQETAACSNQLQFNIGVFEKGFRDCYQ